MIILEGQIPQMHTHYTKHKMKKKKEKKAGRKKKKQQRKLGIPVLNNGKPEKK